METTVYLFVAEGGDAYAVVMSANPENGKYLFKVNGKIISCFDDQPTVDCFFKNVMQVLNK